MMGELAWVTNIAAVWSPLDPVSREEWQRLHATFVRADPHRPEGSPFTVADLKAMGLVGLYRAAPGSAALFRVLDKRLSETAGRHLGRAAE